MNNYSYREDGTAVMNLVNIKTNHIQRCAFCKHWYDPTNAALKMRDPAAGLVSRFLQ